MITQQRPYILEGKTQAFVDVLSAQGGKPIYEIRIRSPRLRLRLAQPHDLTPARRDATVVPVGGREVNETFEAVLRERSIDPR
jgi:hypothetical protein